MSWDNCLLACTDVLGVLYDYASLYSFRKA